MTSEECKLIHNMAADAGLLSEDVDGNGSVRIYNHAGHAREVHSVTAAECYLEGVLHGSKYRLWLEQQDIKTGQEFREWVSRNFTEGDLQALALSSPKRDTTSSDQESPEQTRQNGIRIVLRAPDVNGDCIFERLEGYDGKKLDVGDGTAPGFMEAVKNEVVWSIPLDALLRVLGEIPCTG